MIRDTHLQVSSLRHRDESGKRRSGKISRFHTSSIENGRVYKIQKTMGKENSRVRIGCIAFTAEASNL